MRTQIQGRRELNVLEGTDSQKRELLHQPINGQCVQHWETDSDADTHAVFWQKNIGFTPSLDSLDPKKTLSSDCFEQFWI